MTTADLLPSSPPLGTDSPIIGLSDDTKPDSVNPLTGAALSIGDTFLEEDTGHEYYWTGTAWLACTLPQKLDRMFRVQVEIRDMLREITAT